MAYPKFDPRYQQHYFQPRASAGMIDPALLEGILAMVLAGRGQEASPESSRAAPRPQVTENVENLYLGNPRAPSPRGLSPMGRYRDMGLRREAQLAEGMEEGRAVVAALQEAQKAQEVASSGLVSPVMTAQGPGAVLSSPYGTGSATMAPPGVRPQGLFGTSSGEMLPFGQIGGMNAGHSAGPDPESVTWQQQQIMDDIARKLNLKRKR